MASSAEDTEAVVELHALGYLEPQKASLVDCVRSAICKLAGDHIWHCGQTPVLNGSNEMLSIRVQVSDCVDDEWLMFAIARHVTLHNASIAARCYNTHDGEFGLIEAADCLPSWASDPQHAYNRLWMLNGDIVLIPPGCTSTQASRDLELHVALHALQSNSLASIRAPKGMRKVIEHRLDEMPERAVARNVHKASCLLPLRAAAALQKDPLLVASAIASLRARDPKLFRYAASCRSFPPSHGTTFALVRFTKLLFAQLQAEQYNPPKTWPLQNDRNSSVRNAAILGAKLTAGLEMLAAQKQQQEDEANDGQSSLSVTDDDIAHIEVLERPPVGDDDSWLEEGEALLQAKEAEQAKQLQHDNGSDSMQQESDAENRLERTVNGLREFLEEQSGPEGAEDERDGGAAFDADKFVRELSRALNCENSAARSKEALNQRHEHPEGDGDNDDELDKEDDEDEEKEEEDDDIGEEAYEFMEEYEGAMASELRSMGATLGMNQADSSSAAAASDVRSDRRKESEEPKETEPVHIDEQLVANIVKSYTAQGGNAGPASNVLGKLGLSLPEEDSREDDGQDEAE